MAEKPRKPIQYDLFRIIWIGHNGGVNWIGLDKYDEKKRQMKNYNPNERGELNVRSNINYCSIHTSTC